MTVVASLNLLIDSSLLTRLSHRAYMPKRCALGEPADFDTADVSVSDVFHGVGENC